MGVAARPPIVEGLPQETGRLARWLANPDRQEARRRPNATSPLAIFASMVARTGFVEDSEPRMRSDGRLWCVSHDSMSPAPTSGREETGPHGRLRRRSHQDRRRRAARRLAAGILAGPRRPPSRWDGSASRTSSATRPNWPTASSRTTTSRPQPTRAPLLLRPSNGPRPAPAGPGGRSQRTAATDRPASRTTSAPRGVRYVVLPHKGRPTAARRQIEPRRARRKMVRWRTGCERRISCARRHIALNCTKISDLMDVQATRANTEHTPNHRAIPKVVESAIDRPLGRPAITPRRSSGRSN
jgi:hypothetical protein